VASEAEYSDTNWLAPDLHIIRGGLAIVSFLEWAALRILARHYSLSTWDGTEVAVVRTLGEGEGSIPYCI